MLCEACKKNQATIHYFESIDGRARTLNLCESCAALKGIGVNLSVISFESFMKMTPELKHAPGAEPSKNLTCVGCGMTYADFRHNPGKACPACLDTFLSREELVRRGRNLRKIADTSNKQPQISTSEKFALAVDNRVDGLKRLMARAVELEEFEEAARLRDLIKQANEGAAKA